MKPVSCEKQSSELKKKKKADTLVIVEVANIKNKRPTDVHS